MPSSTIPRGNVLYTTIFSTTLTPTQVSGATTAEQSFTILGLLPGDYLACQFQGVQTAGLSVANVRVSAANTATLAFNNATASPATPASGVYGFIWGRPENLPVPANAS